MRLLLLHPLPFDGSIFGDGIRSLVEVSTAPTLYEAGDDITLWAEAALDAVGDGPVVVVGNSVGGSCAIEVARLAPTKVTALVLCGAKPAHRRVPAARDDALRCLADEGLDAAWERYWLPLFGPDTPAEVIDRAWCSVSQIGPDLIAAGVRAFHGRPDGAEFLRSWRRPVWIVSGEHDIDPTRDRRLAGSLPNSTFELVPEAGHYLPLEAPDALASITARALTTAG